MNIGSNNAENTKKAVDWIRPLTREVEAGENYTGKVTRVLPFGAFVEILPGKEGLVHISELANFRVPSVEDVVKIGDEIQVLVTEIDRQGRVNLSRRALLEPAENGHEGGRGGRAAQRRRRRRSAAVQRTPRPRGWRSGWSRWGPWAGWRRLCRPRPRSRTAPRATGCPAVCRTGAGAGSERSGARARAPTPRGATRLGHRPARHHAQR